jgi:uncharacterized protein
MTEKVVLHGHIISRGVAEGEALVTDRPLSFYAGSISNEEGMVRMDGHPLEGQFVKDKVLIYDTCVYSTGAALSLYTKSLIYKTAPAAVICRRMHNIAAGGLIYSGIPAMDRLKEGDPWSFIKTGDWVKVDADRGIIEVTPRAMKKTITLGRQEAVAR